MSSEKLSDKLESSNDGHERVTALFLGPKAENHEFVRECFGLIIAKQLIGRDEYFPSDEKFISSAIIETSFHVKKKQEMKDKLEILLKSMNKWSIPFYSPRYGAHICMDQSLPAILGYLASMFYNPNNVAFEGGPFTTQLEVIVGRQLCEMMGYSLDKVSTDSPVAWGHITSGGTVANIESIWAARNLKFYPLSLRDAMAEKKPLEFIADTFNIKTCKGTTKLLKECTVWELLNLKVSTVVEIPDRLYKQYQISSTFLDSVMKDYLIQTVSKDVLMARWGIKDQPTIVVPSTKHYSWPKGAALAGVGSDNVINIDIDRNARMDTDKLRDYLIDCAKKERAVYEVVAVIGSTEEGAVDPLEKILYIRSELQEKGLSFVIHADAAWGGYFASMLPSHPTIPYRADFVPRVDLRPYVESQLVSLRAADSITIDPHKLGYVPYPAGALCYRDGRMRHLLTWTTPVFDQGSEGESIGVYGVEGSKPGAAASAVYLAHQVIGTGYDGYGTLLGEASFTSRRFASHWAAMSDEDASFIVTPLDLLPCEVEHQSTSNTIDDDKKLKAKIKDQKKFIRERILGIENSVLVNDKDAMAIFNKMGSDLNINVFACNFRKRKVVINANTGIKEMTWEVNTDVEEANWLNRRIFERLSVTSPDKDPRTVPFYLTATVFAQSDYGLCVNEFKKRLGLVGKQDLFVLRNVVMSPFATTRMFVREMADIFQSVLKEEVKNARRRNEEKPGTHTFLMQGTDELFLVHLPSFHMASGRRQIILSIDISEDDMTKYTDEKKSNPLTHAFLQNVKPMLLDQIVDGMAFDALIIIQDKLPARVIQVNVSNVKIIKKRSLDAEDFDSSYPELMPFYLYGTSAQPHIDHMLLLAPNIQLSAGDVQLSLNGGKTLSEADLAQGVIAVAKGLHERSMQPFPVMKPFDVPEGFFFAKGCTMDVTVYRDPFPASTTDPIGMEEVKEVLGEGRVTLVGDVYVDSDRLNGEETGKDKDKDKGVFAGKNEIVSFLSSKVESEADEDIRDYSWHDLNNTMSREARKDWVTAVEDFHAKMNSM